MGQLDLPRGRPMLLAALACHLRTHIPVGLLCRCLHDGRTVDRGPSLLARQLIHRGQCRYQDASSQSQADRAGERDRATTAQPSYGG
jgi:hypothetical protein